MIDSLAPETLVQLDELLRAMSLESKQYVEDRLAQERTEVVEAEPPGIELAGEGAQVQQRIQSLEVVGGQVEFDTSNKRGRISIPPQERDLVTLEFVWPDPPSADEKLRLHMAFPAQIIAAEFRLDVPNLIHVQLQVGPRNAWPLRYLVGPVTAGVVAPLASSDTLEITDLDVSTWDTHFLDVGDVVIATLLDAVVLTGDLHLMLTCVRLPVEMNGGGSAVVQSDGLALQGLPDQILVVRL